MASLASSPIASKATECLKLFHGLTDVSSDWSAPVHGIDHEHVLEQLSHFQMWANNIGALQPKHITSSLDHRLREAPKFVAKVVSLLDDLTETLADVRAILVGERSNRVERLIPSESGSSDSGSDEPPSTEQPGVEIENKEEVSEIDELFGSIPDTISRLFKISTIIRNSRSRDKFDKAQTATSQATVDPSYDALHVRQKFPRIQDEGMDWLGARLGRLIAQRRQFMWYSSHHRDRTAKASDNAVAGEMSGQTVDIDKLLKIRSNPQSTPASAPAAADDLRSELSRQAKSILAPTTASTIVANRLETLDLSPGEGDLASEMDTRSVTSYASSAVDSSEESSRLSVIRLEEVASPRKPFECPYCWTIQKFNRQKEWRKHVMADLKPYVCTAMGCEKLFTDSQAWFTHMMQSHLVVWECCFCTWTPFEKLDDFRQHISKNHSIPMSDPQFERVAQTCRQPTDKIAPKDCPLCDTWEDALRLQNTDLSDDLEVVVTPEQFRRHVCGHLEQLALFALAPVPPDGDIEGSAVGIQNGSFQGVSDGHSDVKSAASSSNDSIYAIAAKSDASQLEPLLQGADDETLESLLVAAAANHKHGDQVMKLLLDKIGPDLEIEEEVIEAAAANDFKGNEVMRLLLDRYDNLPVTYEALEAASKNLQDSDEMVRKLVLKLGQLMESNGMSTKKVLEDAARAGNVAIAKACIETGTEMIDKEDIEVTPLVIAAEHGQETIVQLLLDKIDSWADLAEDGYSFTPIAVAAEKGHVSILRLLLDASNHQSLSEQPLLRASKGGHEACVDLLLETGADTVDGVDTDTGETALMLATSGGYHSIISLLLSAGADPILSDGDGRSALSRAADNADEVAFRLLYDEVNFEDVKYDTFAKGTTLLMMAARSGNLAIVQSLVDAGESIDLQDDDGFSALSHAAARGHENIVELLLDAGASAGLDDRHGLATLRLAAKSGCIDLVMRLISHQGSDPDLILPQLRGDVSLKYIKPDTLDPNHHQEFNDGYVVFNPFCPRALSIDAGATLVHDSFVYFVAFSRDNKYLATGSIRTAQIFEVPSGNKICVLENESAEDPLDDSDAFVLSVAFSPDGTMLVTGQDTIVRVWDIESRTLRHRFIGHEQDVYGVDFAPKGPLVASCGIDKTLRTWDIETGSSILVIQTEGGITDVAFSPDARFLATSSLDKTWTIWDSSTGEVVLEPDMSGGHRDSVYGVKFSFDGKHLYTSSGDSTVKQWGIEESLSSRSQDNLDYEKVRCLRTFDSHGAYVLSAIPTPDGRWLISTSNDSSVMIWDSSTGVPQAMIKRHQNTLIEVDVSRDGRYFATASSDMTARIWSYKECQPDVAAAVLP